jgi:hypothetical protein
MGCHQLRLRIITSFGEIALVNQQDFLLSSADHTNALHGPSALALRQSVQSS